MGQPERVGLLLNCLRKRDTAELFIRLLFGEVQRTEQLWFLSLQVSGRVEINLKQSGCIAPFPNRVTELHNVGLREGGAGRVGATGVVNQITKSTGQNFPLQADGQSP